MRWVITVCMTLVASLACAPSAQAEDSSCDSFNWGGDSIGMRCQEYSDPPTKKEPHRYDPHGRGDRDGDDSQDVDPDDGPGLRRYFCIPDAYAEMNPDNDALIQDPNCTPGEETDSDPLTRDEVERMVRSLLATLKVPAPTPTFGPDPSWNEWNMAVVGHPLWLWSDVPRDVGTRVSGGGITISIQAHLDTITYDLGDGTTKTCTTWTPYDRATVTPGDPSPTCGHTYSWPSLPERNYQVRATAQWTASWTALGFSGTVPMESRASASLPVGELHALVKP